MESKPAWQELKNHQQSFNHHMKDLFAQDQDRFNKFHLSFGDILVDYSKNLITSETMGLLFNLLNQTKLTQLTKGMFSGEKINFTEGRPVLHM